jgi:hypothetical protein
LTRFSHPNFICKSEINSIPNDPYFNKQFYLHNTGQIVNDGHSGTNDADIDALEAWNITKGNYDIIIAVLDEGVTSNHPDLPNTRQVRLNGSNFHFGNPNNPSPTDNQNHGNACAGVIAASQNNNQGITGIVPNCRIMPIRMIGASAQKHADAIKFAWENGADILSCSWTFESDNPNLVPVIKDAIIEATTQGRNGKGCVVAFASGNNENQNGIIKFPSNVEVDGVITVGASDRYDLQAQYSPTSDPESGNNQIIDIVAPSHRAYSNQISTETWEVWSIDIPNSSGYNTAHRNDGGSLPLIGEVLPSSGTNYLSYTGRFGGTSAACPQVSAVAAMLLSINPLLTQQEVFSIIKSTADDVGPYDYRLGRCDELGSGRLNACKAALEAISTNGIITGPDRVCYSNTTFSFISPPETVVSWTKSNNIQYVSGQGSPDYTIKANSTSSGPGWIQATISCPDCEPLVYRKEIWVGRPNFTLIGESELEPYSPGVVIISDINGNPIEAGSPNDPQISSVDWSYTGPLDYINGDTEKAYFRASRTGGNGIIYALATNQCGSLESRFYFEVVDIFFKIFPNPVDKYMDIELTNEALYISEKKPADIKIFNNRSVLIYSDNLSNSKLRINTSYLPNGLYVIQVKYDGKIYSKQVLIEH